MSIVFSPSLRCQLPVLLAFLQGTFVVIFILFIDYEDRSDRPSFHNRSEEQGPRFTSVFPIFKDVHLMLFVGLGLMLSFLKLYSFGGIAFNFLIANFAIQWSLVTQGFFYHYKEGKICLLLENVLDAEFAAVTTLISVGAIMGRASHVQLLLCSAIEIPLFVVNDWLINRYFHVIDIGGTIAIHIFSCYFGLGVAQILHQPDRNVHPKEATTSSSDLLSFLGTIFLWIFWPSFNSALAKTEDGQLRAIVNTFLALSSGAMVTFALSSLIDRRGRVSLVHLQNASLAGGVAIGITADLISPGGAIAVGCLAAISCILGYQYLSSFLVNKIKLKDQCGIHNLHGLPGIVGTLSSIVFLLLQPADTYSSSIHEILNDMTMEDQPPIMGVLGNGNTWTARDQALGQAAAFGVTFGISLFGGYITGLLLKLPCFVHPSKDYYFDDQLYFQIPEDNKSKSISNEKLHKHLLTSLKHI